MRTLNNGSHGEDVKRLQRSIHRRLAARGVSRDFDVDGVFGGDTRSAMVTAAYLLGARKTTYDGIRKGSISPAEQTFVMNPGKRSASELATAKKRVAAHKLAVKKQQAASKSANAKRQKIVAQAKAAAANYRKRPGDYHYLAGGIANLIYLSPSPHTYRSDCSQFVASVYKAAGLPTPASVPHQWASTFTMVKAPGVKFVDRAHRKPGMPGMYGSREAPHHTEIYVGEPDVEFIGHGSPPIDSLTPGQPDYYLDFPFLN